MKKLDNVKQFVKEHKYEIILGTGVVIAGVSIIYCKKPYQGTYGNSIGKSTKRGT